MDETSSPAPVAPKKTSRLPFILSLIVLLAAGAAIAVPNFMKSRLTACQNSCVNGLRQMDGAKEQWALETKKAAGAAVSAADETEILKYIKGSAMPICPGGGKLSFNKVGDAPTCTIAGHSI